MSEMEAETDGMRVTRERWEGAPESGELICVRLRGAEGVPLYLRRIPKGRFMMGSRDGEANERPERRVEIGEAFYLGVFPVTQAQFACWTQSPAYAEWFEQASQEGLFDEGASTHVNDFEDRPQNPAENLNFWEASGFCDWLQEWIPAEMGAQGWRAQLPTEAHWEYACRAGTRTDYFGGDGEAALAAMGYFEGNSNGSTQVVGRKKVNAYGLYDLHGNVWEWCRDVYHESSYRYSSSGQRAKPYPGIPGTGLEPNSNEADLIAVYEALEGSEGRLEGVVEGKRVRLAQKFQDLSKGSPSEADSRFYKACAQGLNEGKCDGSIKAVYEQFKKQEASADSLRVLRGGSWYHAAWGCRSAVRIRLLPSYRRRYYGFRVALLPRSGDSETAGGQSRDRAGRQAGAPEAADVGRPEAVVRGDLDLDIRG